MKQLKQLIAYSLLILCAACTHSETDDTKTPSTPPVAPRTTLTIAPSAHTRATLEATEQGFTALWEKNDKIHTLNSDLAKRNEATWGPWYVSQHLDDFIATAQTEGKRSKFSGYTQADIAKGDNILLFYPTAKVNEDKEWIREETISGIFANFPEAEKNYQLLLSTAKQNGSLEDIAKYYDFKSGTAIVTEVTSEGATAEYESSMTNLMSIQTLHFLDAKGEPISNIKEVIVGAVPTQAAYDFVTIKPEQSNNEITLTHFEGNKSYLVLFPSESQITYVLRTTDNKTYVGVSAKRKYEGGKGNDISIKLKDVTEGVTIGPFTFAPANLYYNSQDATTEGFIPGWSLKDTNREISSASRRQTIGLIFPYGVVGKDAFAPAYTPLLNKSPQNTTAFSSTYYSDLECSIPTAQPQDMTTSAYGDLAHWASKGKYRLPTKEEFEYLLAHSTLFFGVKNGNGIDSEPGFVFHPAKTSKILNNSRQLSTYDITAGVFLPLSYTTWINTNNSITIYPIVDASPSLKYWSSTPASATETYVLKLHYDDNTQKITTHEVVAYPKGFTMYNIFHADYLHIRPIKAN